MQNKNQNQTNQKQAEPKLQGITVKKDEDFSEWFTQLMLKADLADYTDISGCLVFKPASYALWEKIVHETDVRLKAIGIRNAYFPLFIPEKAFAKEAEHVEGFTPEVAWVTHAGTTPLAEKLAIRPTSEAIMYESYSKWIRSWRDLPLKINQWNNVVRWEFKHPVPFFRTREFLWNEAHNVYATEQETVEDGEKILKAYVDVCENYMGLYGMPGKKTDNEKFAGAVFSKKLHYYLPNGRVIEGPCFHYDGQNFAKAYHIEFSDENGEKQFPHQSTFAISTRMLGTMFAVHSDEKGLIIPPKIAEIQVVIVPILFDDTKAKVLEGANKIKEILKENLVHIDSREEYKPGWKFNEWELKGVPIRIEFGPKDLEKESAMVVRRDTFEKTPIAIKELNKKIPAILEDMQALMLKKSKDMLLSNIVKARTLDETTEFVKNKKIAIAPMCKTLSCEEELKAKTGGAKTLFIDETQKVKHEECIVCGNRAEYFVHIGKTY